METEATYCPEAFVRDVPKGTEEANYFLEKQNNEKCVRTQFKG